MRDYFSNLCRLLPGFLLGLTFHVGVIAAANPPGRPVPSCARLSDHVPSQALKDASFVEKLDASVQIPVTFVLPLRDRDTLEELVLRLHDPTDVEHYGQYLTPEEFVDRFAPTQEEYEEVVAYAKNMGLSINHTHSNRTLVNATGSVECLEKAFNLQIHLYKNSKGRKFYAPTDNPEIPDKMGAMISSIVGLDNHAVWRCFNRQKKIVEPFQANQVEPHAFPSGPGGGYSPNDILRAYNLTGVSVQGSGQNVALFELAKYRSSDINTYTNYFHLPAADIETILVDGGSRSGIHAEVTLDIELVLALAPECKIYVYEGPNTFQGVLDTYNRIATDNIAKQVSTSWGLGEELISSRHLQAENNIFLQMASQGQTIYAAAGDSGAYDNYPSTSLMVDDPASQPYVVGVGGTTLQVNASTGAYASESVWNNGLGLGAGGGGVSTIWTIPSWQVGVVGASSTTHRNVPDVALNSDPNTGYAIYHNGGWAIYGGTSCAAPLWAGFTALVNQQRVANEQPVLGFANPIFYAMGADDSYASDFHDITSGDNLHYSASMRYDNATGWGSFNGAHLFATLTYSTPPPPPHVPAPVLAIAMNHAPFTKKGGSYQINVSNSGDASTAGTVSVALTLPTGLVYKSFSGLGWTFSKKTMSFTRKSVLIAGSSYPPIKVNVTLARKPPSSVTTSATVSGGGSDSSTVSDPTTLP